MKYLILFVVFIAMGLQNTGNLHVQGTFRYEDGNQGKNKILVSDPDGNASWTNESTIDGPESPVSVSFLNDFADYGSSFAPVTYYKHKERVYISGLVKQDDDGTLPNATIFNLPVGYRPSEDHIFYATSNNAGCRVDVQSDGDVIIIVCNDNLAFISLSGISFRVVPTL